MATKEVRANSPTVSDNAVIWMLLGGLYLLAGAYYGFAYEKWPFFRPPQLDVFGWLFSAFGEKIGGYVGGGLLAALGLILLAGGIASLLKQES